MIFIYANVKHVKVCINLQVLLALLQLLPNIRATKPKYGFIHVWKTYTLLPFNMRTNIYICGL